MPIDLLISDNSPSTVASNKTRDVVNVASHLVETARQCPTQRAIIWRDLRTDAYVSWTFATLNDESDRYAHGLSAAGIRRETRTVLMVRPTVEFFALTFALYKIGAVPVLVDPGMGRQRMAECLGAIEAEAFIGIPRAHLFRLIHSKVFRALRVVITAGRKYGWSGHRLDDLRQAGPAQPFESAATSPDDPAAIIFTTGSTGPPKAVLYRHGTFDAQIRILRDHFGIQPGEIDLPTFPLFALFDPALGMTAVLPEMDPTRPAHVDPHKIIRTIQDQNVTHMFGSPALLDRVRRYAQPRAIRLLSLRRVISAGAPVPSSTLERFAALLSEDAEIHTPYGATEALPVASISSREILSQTAKMSAGGAGTCVGLPIDRNKVRVIRISDIPIAEWRDELEMPRGQIGEIVVSGPVVTREYLSDGDSAESRGAVATRLAKIREGELVWHRMGDVGYFDEQGRLWFCGRKAHRVEAARGTLFSDQVEGVFNQHHAVFRSALVGVGPPGRQLPVMCIELEGAHRRSDKNVITRQLLDLAARHSSTRGIETFLFHRAFPVDIRHNAKIFREKLAIWAARQLRE